MDKELRPLNQKLITIVGDSLKKKVCPIIIYEAPTGYGKTSLSGILTEKIMKNEDSLCSRLLHILPMRSLVERIYLDFKENKYPLPIDKNQLGYQCMSLIDESKSPQFLKPMVITTFDSFVYNLYKLPVAEMHKEHPHYEVPRMSIYTSATIFDEAHLYGGDPGLVAEEHYYYEPGNKMYLVLRASVKLLTRSLTPTIILTATMPSIFIKGIQEAINYYKSSNICVKVIKPESWGDLGEFKSVIENVNWRTILLDDVQWLKKVKEEYNSGKRILIVRNKVLRAVSTYKKLIDEGISSVMLLHGRLTLKDRLKYVNQINRCKILVATQIVEAGINESFDVLITDPAPPTTLTQRAGRIKRGKYAVGEAVICISDCEKCDLSEPCKGVYNIDIVKRTIEKIRNYCYEKDKYIDWRCPLKYDHSNYVSYKDLIDEIYSSADMTDMIGVNSSLYLWILDLPGIGTKTARELEEKICGLVRDVILVPLTLGNEDLDIKELRELSLGVNLNWLRKNIDILERRDGKIKLLTEIIEREKSPYIKTFYVEPNEIFGDKCRSYIRYMRYIRRKLNINRNILYISALAFKIKEEEYEKWLPKI